MSGLVHSSGGQRPGLLLGQTALVVVVVTMTLAALGGGCSEPRELGGTPEPGEDGGEAQPGRGADGAALDAQMPGEVIGGGSGGAPSDGGLRGTGGGGILTGSGGVTPGSGGARASTGGAPPGSGGAPSGSGGARAGSGGATPGSGGARAGSGGAAAASGGYVGTGGITAPAGSGGSASGTGGATMMTASGGATGVVDGGSDAPPACTGTSRLCNGKCIAATMCCTDGDCPPQNGDGDTAGPAGTCNTSTKACEYPPTTHATLYTFDSGIEPWTLYMTSPTRLADKTRVSHDARGGENSSGALKVEAPFDGSNQKVEFQDMRSPSLALGGRTIRARVRLGSGLSDDTTHPGAIKLFAKSGASFDYASGPWSNLVGTGWVDVTLNADKPDFTQGPFSPADVRQIGFELRVFSDTQRPAPATVFIDSVRY